MKDNEIIKALECHKSKSLVDCERCPLYAKKVGFEHCHIELFDCVFDLINRQKAEIERLEKTIKSYEKIRRAYQRYIHGHGWEDLWDVAIKEFAKQIHKSIDEFKEKREMPMLPYTGYALDYVDMRIDKISEEMTGDQK